MILGIEVGASESEVRKAYRASMLQAHPDKGGSEEATIMVTSAFKRLCREPVPSTSTTEGR